MRSWLLATLTLLCTGALHAQAPDISRARVERVIEALAADEMHGRSAFSPFAAQAADLIAGEFAAAGLEPYADESSFQQTFEASALAVRRVDIRIDGDPVPGHRAIVSAGATSTRWTGPDDVEVVRIVAQEGPGAVIGALQSAEGDLLLLLDEAHEPLFRQLGPLLSRQRYTLDEPTGATRIVVLGGARATTFSVEVDAAHETRELANVVGRLPGRRADELVLFSAHYDHIGIVDALDGDSIANGANDNASGTAAVVALAHHFASRGTPERTLLFVAFTAEEAGGLGATYFSRRLDPERVVAMFNIEMIGKPAVSGPNTAWLTGWDRSDFGTILERAVVGTGYSFYADPYPDQNLFYRSDNATLARLGVPAHSISTTPIDVDTDYHTATDEVSTLDLDHTTNTIRAIALGAETIVSGAETPTRVDLQTVN